MHHAFPAHEELVLKPYCDLPNLTAGEVEEVCKLAQVSWASQYGSPRARSSETSRSDKGIKRSHRPHGAFTESSFVKRRRSAAAAAALSAEMGGGEDPDLQLWTERHRKEQCFFEKKKRSRQIQAVAEGYRPRPCRCTGVQAEVCSEPSETESSSVECRAIQ